MKETLASRPPEMPHDPATRSTLHDALPITLLTLAGLGVLSAIGHLAAPGPRAPSVVGAVMATPLPPSTAPDEPGDVRREDVRLTLRGLVVEATVRSPASTGAHPAMVLVHGAGRAHRSALADQAEAFARRGVVTLVADKRSSGYSFTNRDFDLLADDALVALAHLRTRPDVDPRRVGLWGSSEGGWIVPLAAVRSDAVAFAILVSAPTMSPLRQSMWVVDDRLRAFHAPSGVRSLASRFLSRGRFNYLHHDPAAVLRRVRQPVLGMFGERDRAMPVSECVRDLTAALEQGGNRHVAVHVYPNADHGIRTPDGRLADGYVDALVAWVHGLPGGGATPPDGPVAGAVPSDQVAAPHPVMDPWYGGDAAHGLAFTVAAGGLLAGPVASRVARRRGSGASTRHDGERSPWPDVRQSLRRTGRLAVGLVVLLHIVGGLAIGLALAGVAPGALAVGWLAARAAAVAAVALAAVSVTLVGAALRSGWRPSPPERATLVGTFGSTCVLLLTGAYWGLFDVGW